MLKIAAKDLENFVVDLFEAAGASGKEAKIVAGHLVDATLAGVYSHGVIRVPQYVKAMQTGQVKLNTTPRIHLETESTAVVDGGNGFGQVVCSEAMTLAIGKSLDKGIAAVTVHNCFHSGRIASYTKMAAERGLIAIVMVNAGGAYQSVVPFGGLARRLATNPVSIAAPSEDGRAIAFDIASSVAPEGKVRDYYERGKPVPPGWLIDSKGRATTDPKDFYDSGGALLPLGGSAGYKGFGLAFMIDILAGALSGAGCCRPDVPKPTEGLLMIVIDVKRFVSMTTYYKQVSALVEHVKSCPPAPGYQEVFVPGELELEEENLRRREGIPLDEKIWRAIQETATSAGLNGKVKEWAANETPR